MKDHLEDLLKYSHYYNVKLIERFNDGDLHLAIPDKAMKFLCHILNAQAIWNNRLQDISTEVEVWKVFEKSELMTLEQEHYQKSLELLEKMDLEKMIHYSNTKGEQYKNSVKDILFHIVNHATYHRGQIATEMRKAGLSPIVSDFVYYKHQNPEL